MIQHTDNWEENSKSSKKGANGKTKPLADLDNEYKHRRFK
jgi:hypothetical protein